MPSCMARRAGILISMCASWTRQIRISVIDEGEGIPKETLAKIFDKFYRGAKTKKGGLGLGLSIARRFVQLNEGDVEAENLSPQGFMVTITLPMAEKE